MRIEFRTFLDVSENEKMGQIYAKHCMDKQNKQYKKMNILAVVVGVLALVTGVFSDMPLIAPVGLFYMLIVLLLTNVTRKKAIPKSFCQVNNVGCPYNVTFGLYDEYFYEKFENNMSISEHSIRYEFLQKIVETPEYFVMMTKRSQFFFLPKRDMGYENVLELSKFCKNRLPYIYSVES